MGEKSHRQKGPSSRCSDRRGGLLRRRSYRGQVKHCQKPGLHVQKINDNYRRITIFLYALRAVVCSGRPTFFSAPLRSKSKHGRTSHYSEVWTGVPTVTTPCCTQYYKLIIIIMHFA